MKLCILTASVLALLFGFALQPTHAAEARPNILLVVADDMGWTDLGSFGSEIETPNLDALAQRGIKFTGFTVSVSCSPTRSMLLSGNDNHVAGLGNMVELLTKNQIDRPGYEGHLNDRVVSLAEVLRDGGYHTYLGGKWHLGHEPGSIPFDRGFERTFSMLNGGASHWSDMYGILPSDDPAKYTMDGKFLNSLPADFYSSRSYADFLIEAIRENRDDGKPFLAYLAFTAVHDPGNRFPSPGLSKYRGRYDTGYGALKAKRWESAKRIGVAPKSAKLAARHPMIEPWEDLDDDERAVQARGMEVLCRYARSHGLPLRSCRGLPQGHRRVRQHGHHLPIRQRREPVVLGRLSRGSRKGVSVRSSTTVWRTSGAPGRTTPMGWALRAAPVAPWTSSR